MSSTKRGGQREISDYYMTPQVEIEKFLSSWIEELERPYHYCEIGSYTTWTWFDPCAGGDEKNEASYPVVLRRMFPGITVGTMDIRGDSRAVIIHDYLKYQFPNETIIHVIITNPPFSLAQEIIQKALQDVSNGGYVIMLLRLNFLGSVKRFPFWNQQLPVWCYVHHNRMSFTPDGKTDSIEYAHFIWQKNTSPDFTMMKVI